MNYKEIVIKMCLVVEFVRENNVHMGCLVFKINWEGGNKYVDLKRVHSNPDSYPQIVHSKNCDLHGTD